MYYISVIYESIALGKRKDITKWCIPVTIALDKEVEKAVAKNSHITKSDLVRDAVRQLLTKMQEKSTK
jgi:hypothetical protein